MWFLAIFGKNVEDALGRLLRYLAFYAAGGFAAAALQTATTLLAGTAADARVPVLGASGAIAAVLGAYWTLYPGARILTIVGTFPVRIAAWVFLGLWFVYQLIEANAGLGSAGETDAWRSSRMSAASSPAQSWPSCSSDPGAGRDASAACSRPPDPRRCASSTTLL